MGELRPRRDTAHGSADGNYAHVAGLYDVLSTLRARYPERCVIENCSQGGNRLDFGMLHYTDVAWMDDVSAPSSHVRHNIEGLATLFPAAYLLSFVMDHAQEPIHDAEDLSLYFKSRMLGVLGLTIRGEEFGESQREAMAAEIRLYKRTRPLLRHAVAIFLTDQVKAAGGRGLDAVELLSSRTGDAALFTFVGPGAVDGTTVFPRALDVASTYALRSGGLIAIANGVDLMAEGVGVEASSSAAQLLLLYKRSSSPAP